MRTVQQEDKKQGMGVLCSTYACMYIHTYSIWHTHPPNGLHSACAVSRCIAQEAMMMPTLRCAALHSWKRRERTRNWRKGPLAEDGEQPFIFCTGM